MPVIGIPIIIVGAGLLGLIFFVVKNSIVPKRLENIDDYIKQGKHTQAANGAKILIARDPRNVDARYLLGKAYLGDGKPELAFMEFKAINQIGKFGEICREVPFRREAATLYEQYNQIEEALKEYLLLMKLEPEVADHYFKIGVLFEKRDDPKRSYGYYKKAVKLDNDHAEAHEKLGLLLYRAKKAAEARSELSLAVKLNPSNSEAYFYLGKLHKDSGDHTTALTYFEKALNSPDLKVKALVERGGSYMSMGNFERAISELSRAVRITDSETSTETLYGRYFLAMAYEKTRQLEKAIEQWEKIYAKKPSFQDVAGKLSQYQDLRTDDHVKDYLTSSQEEFFEICSAAVRSMNLDPRDVTAITSGCQIVAGEAASKWRNARKMPRLIWFLRIPDPVDEPTIRQLLEVMRKMNVTRGIVLTSSVFTRKAANYAESRPIDLVKKEKLQNILRKAG